jgi:hypothetical protein
MKNFCAAIKNGIYAGEITIDHEVSSITVTALSYLSYPLFLLLFLWC